MITLLQHLANLPARDLRAVASRLHLTQHGQHQKQPWITAIHSGWHTPATAQRWLAQLSPAAHTALQRLCPLHQLPLPLFVAQFGNVRRVTHQQRWPTPPWQAPQTVAEELYYSGLLVPGPHPLWHKATFVTLPADLRPLLVEADTVTGRQGDRGTRRQGDTYPEPGRREETRSDALTTDLLTTDLLRHDLAQLLIYLHSQAALAAPPPCTHGGRWLAPRHLQPLNQRLLQPEPAPLARSHKQTERLRLLFFLAHAAGLVAHGTLTPLAWTWLACSPAQQLDQLWQAWQQANAALRTSYHQPDADLPPPWPQPLLHALRTVPPAFTPTELTAALLNADLTLHPYWVAHLPDLSAFDQLVTDLLTTLLQPLAVVQLISPAQPTAPSANTAPRFQLTAVGQWLLAPTAPTQPITTATGAIARCLITTDAWQLHVPATAPSLAQAQLAPYAHYQALATTATPATHHYQLDAQSVSRAAAHSLGLPTLATALAGLGLALTPAHWQQLHTWHAAGQAVHLALALLLRTATPDQLAQIHQTPDLRALISEILSPTTALLTDSLTVTAQRLQTAGIAIATPPDPTSAPVPASAALWLAGQLYAQIGHYLPLPQPPPFGELQALLQRLPPDQQAVLHGQWQALHEQLLTLLDGLPFTPPPAPSDPDQWRPLITQAIAAPHNLRLDYFSPGRNLLTRRLVEPYWLEEHYGVPYLFAYCHQAGRTLTFRLDRFMALTPVTSESVSQ